MSDRLTYGWRGDRLLHISEAPRGLEGKCVCPHCRAPLVAKKGRKYAHHFSHYRREACRGGLETLLHLLAKDILKKHRVIVWPALFLPGKPEPLEAARRVVLDRVRLETYGAGCVPDLTVKPEGGLWTAVEIRVTHACSREKVRNYQRRRMPVLEIDLSAWAGKAIETPELTRQLLGGTAGKQWLYHPRIARVAQSLRERSRERKVHHYHKGGRHFLTVFDCPLRKRSWGNQWGRQTYFADFAADCLFCSNCLEVRYREHWVGDRWSFRHPEAVFCWGHLSRPEE